MDGIAAAIARINEQVNAIVWGPAMIALMLAAGVYLTVGTGFFQVTRFAHMLRTTIGALFRRRDVRKTKDEHSISQFQALTTALAATAGTGNIIGVATAISAGGAGAVFWMWVSAFFGMMTKYAENVLGIYYRRRNAGGEWIGGPMIYLETGLRQRWLAVLFSIFCIIASFGIGNIAQINGVSASICDSVGAKAAAARWLGTAFGMGAQAAENAGGLLVSLIVGIAAAVFVGVSIFGGLKRIASVTEKLVPAISVLYILGTLVVICANARNLLPALAEILEGAFSRESVGGGVLGYAAARAIRFGTARGVFTNEAGLGSSVLVHSSADVKEPAVQAMWSIFEVFVDTIVVCSLTALAIITSGAHNVEGLVGVEITAYAFHGAMGQFGTVMLTVGVVLFALSTLLGWSVYGVRAAEYLGGRRLAQIYKAAFSLVVVLGAVSSVQLVWDLSDTFNALMALPNLIGVLLLSPVVFRVTRNYCDRTFKHKKIAPLLSYKQGR